MNVFPTATSWELPTQIHKRTWLLATSDFQPRLVSDCYDAKTLGHAQKVQVALHFF